MHTTNCVLRSAAALCLLLPSVVGAQSDGTEPLEDVRARTAIQLVLRNTQAKGVPIDPLVRKVREGVSKQADPASIQTAVQVMADRLVASFNALAPHKSVDELSAGALALQAGVPAATLRELRKLSPAQPLTVPLGTLAELVFQKVSVRLATKRVRELVQNGVSNPQLIAMRESIEADVEAGFSPDAALDLRAKGVMSLLTFSGTTTVNGVQPSVPVKTPIRPKR